MKSYQKFDSKKIDKFSDYLINFWKIQSRFFT